MLHKPGSNILIVFLRCSNHSHVNIESMSVGVWSHEAYIRLAILDVGACRKRGSMAAVTGRIDRCWHHV